MKQVEKWEAKKKRLLSKGVKIELMRECDWLKLLETDPNVSRMETRMPRILQNDTEESLLEAIKNDKVFGFAKCDVRTDPQDIAKMEKVMI